MSRAISAGLKTALGEEVVGLATLAKITRRDGTSFFLTDHDQNIDFNGDTYLASGGFDRSALEAEEGTVVGDVDFRALLDNSIITDDELRNGLFNYARCTLYAINHLDTSLGVVTLMDGRFGTVRVSANGYFEVTLLSKMERLKSQVGRFFAPTCVWDLGDPTSCKVPISPPLVQRSAAYEVADFVKVATTTGSGSQVYENRIYECVTAGTTDSSQPTYDTTPGNTTNDGSATFRAHESWSRSGTVATIITQRKEFTITVTESRDVDDWFTLGGIVFESGNNPVEVHEVRSWVQSSATIKLAIGTRLDIQVGDIFRIWPGCNRILDDHCRNKFVMSGSINFAQGNVRQHGGFHYLPGRKKLLKAPSPED